MIKTSEQFALRCCVVTLGVGLMLPEISWLRPLGLLVLTAGTMLFRFESKASMGLGRLFILLALIMAQVLLGLESWGRQALQSIVPAPWFAVLIIGIWVHGLIADYRKWKAIKKDPLSRERSLLE